MSLRDKFYDLGPVVKPRDDKFLSSFVLRFFFIVIPAQAGIHCPAGICVAYATALLITGLLRYARNDKGGVIHITCGSRGLHPPAKTDLFAGPRPRDDKKGTQGPGHGMTKRDQGSEYK